MTVINNALPSSRSVAGLRVLITGAASGMGEAAAHVFAADNARVAVTDRDSSGADRVARDILANGGNAAAFPLDVSDADNILRTVNDIVTDFGGIDILINNAGISIPVAINAPEYDDIWDQHLGVLLTAHQRLVRAVLPYLQKSMCPRIINVASTEALGATAGLSPYSAAKAGVVGLTRSLAVELGTLGITVNCICPGPIETGMTASIADDAKATYAARRTALRRYGKPEEIAHMMLSIALPAAAYLTGAIIPVDGGLMARNS